MVFYFHYFEKNCFKWVDPSIFFLITQTLNNSYYTKSHYDIKQKVWHILFPSKFSNIYSFKLLSPSFHILKQPFK
jgi:hypothetical protein